MSILLIRHGETELNAARARVGGPLAVVTHGLVIRVLLQYHAGLASGTVAPERMENTSVTRFDPDPPYRVLELNCARHLEVADLGSSHAISGI